jgi:hypothetical protein
MDRTMNNPTLLTALNHAQAVISARHTKTPRVTVPHRILLKATREFMTTGSGKTIWKTKGNAQSALRNDLECIFSIARRKKLLNPELTYEDAKNAIQEFINTKVEFIPFLP